MPTPAETIKRSREARGLTMSKLAARVGCTRAAIHLWERAERTPRPRYAAALERALGLPAGSVLESERPPTLSAEGQDHTDVSPKINGEDYCG